MKVYLVEITSDFLCIKKRKTFLKKQSAITYAAQHIKTAMLDYLVDYGCCDSINLISEKLQREDINAAIAYYNFSKLRDANHGSIQFIELEVEE